MNDVANAFLFGGIENALGVGEHVHAVARQQKDAVDALKRGAKRGRIVEVKGRGIESVMAELRSARFAPRRANEFDRTAIRVLFQKPHDRASHSSGCACHKYPSCHVVLPITAALDWHIILTKVRF